MIGRWAAAGALAGLTLLIASTALAVPRMSVTAGSPCITCHVNPTGGGLRNEIGFGSMDAGSLLEFGHFAHNALFDDLVSVGMDVRVQAVRFGGPTTDPNTGAIVEPDVEVFPMQVQPYLGIKPMSGLWIYGSYAMGRKTVDEGELCDEHFPGQSCFDAAVQYQPSPTLPTFRVGMIQPSIGIRRDDHTIYIRSDALDRQRPIVPPNYAEWGAEASWQPESWIRGELGVFDVTHLEEVLDRGVADESEEVWPVAVSARFTVLPQISFAAEEAASGDDEFDDDEFGDDFGEETEPAEPFVINTWLGSSIYASGDFWLVNVFGSAGLYQGVEIHAEAAFSGRTSDYDTLNILAGASYAPWSWLAGSVRYERAVTTYGGVDTVVTQAVAGLELFPVPFVEIRPEYRIVRTDDYLFGQPTVQLHLFY